jgi:2-keto-4-pentenoate hydratase/2-oxohepta-3-ene-1,7-dioic acid hydratase in catechol pathway
MRLCRFDVGSGPQPGIVEDGYVVDRDDVSVRQPFPDGLLKVGDVVRVEIDGIGELRNVVVEEPAGYLAPEAHAEETWVC